MNQATPDALLRAARDLFAELGYDGTSVREITRRAGANLGAITYHFGSKEALYEAVVASVAEPLRQRLAATADRAGTPLERIEYLVREFFDYLGEQPQLPRLMMHALASARPIPEAAVRAVRGNLNALTALIRAGQEDGSIRVGDPLFLALSVGAQPLWLALARRALVKGAAIDQSDPETRARLVESVVRFVRAGLASHPELDE
jgi:AcrR family transcriptional regulator